MIKKKEFYIVGCDTCRILLDDMDYGVFTCYDTKAKAKKAIKEMDWQSIAGGKHLCYTCFEAKK